MPPARRRGRGRSAAIARDRPACRGRDAPRPAMRAGVGHGRAADGAEVALNAGRGLVIGGLALQVAELLQHDADVGRNRRRHRAPAAFAMAVHHPFRLAGELVLDAPALAVALGGDGGFGGRGALARRCLWSGWSLAQSSGFEPELQAELAQLIRQAAHRASDACRNCLPRRAVAAPRGPEMRRGSRAAPSSQLSDATESHASGTAGGK